MSLEGGWLVGERLSPPGGTGGHFSVRYKVTSEAGEVAFLKALDVKSLAQASDLITAMKELGTSFDHEREMLNRCQHMSRVVTSITNGQVFVPASPFGAVPYFIFTMAEGDIRLRLDHLGDKATAAWKLRSLHQVATGISQMHAKFIAHQDIKPSNILMFGDGSRIGDLGRVSALGVKAQHDEYSTPGDLTYAPPEILYGYLSPDWSTRRFGHDVYLLGNMVVFLFSQLSMNAILYNNLDTQFRPYVWTADYDSVLPYLQDAFAKAVEQFCAQIADAQLAPDLRNIITRLCNPDIRLRGNTQNRRAARSQFALEYYVSTLNYLARRAELQLSAAQRH